MYSVEGERVSNLFFAGEHISLEAAGYMEGGCETGKAVAVAILEDLGVQAEAAQQRTRVEKNRMARLRQRGRFPFPGLA